MKRIASGLLAILTLALAFPAGAFAQNTINVQPTSGDPGDNGVVVRIELGNNTDVGGFQFTLTDETGDLTPQSVRAGTRVDGLFDISDNIVKDANGVNGRDEVRVLGVSLNTQQQQVLTPGSGVIVEVLYDVNNGASGTHDLTLSDVVVSDPDANQISPVTATDGVFSVVQTPPTALAFQDAETVVSVEDVGTVTVTLDNTQLTGSRNVAAIEFTLVDGSASTAPISNIIDYVDGSAVTVGRADGAGFMANANETQDGLKVTITNSGGGFIPAGDGAIATLQFRGINSGTAQIAYSNVILADEDAVALPQGAHGGTQVRVNAPPALDNLEDAAIAYTENDAPTPVTASLTVEDDGGTLNIATVQITQGYQPGEDLLAADPNTIPLPGGIVHNFDASTGRLTLSGTASATDYQAAFRAVTYENTSENPNTATRQLTFSTDDGVSDPVAPTPNIPSNSLTRDINITSVNDPPSFTIGPDQVITEGAGAQTVPGWATNLSTGGEAGQSLTFIIQSSNPNLFSAGPAISPDGELTYTPAENATGTADVFVFAQDNGGSENGGSNISPTQNFTITINAVNDPPTISAPSQLAMSEDGALVFEDANSIIISDVDAGDGDIKVTLTATSTVTLANTTGVTVTGDGTDNVVLTGDLAAVNSALSGLTYRPTLNNDGDGTLQIDVDDQGNTGGAAQTASHTVSISITPVNDAPTITNTVTSFTAEENQSFSFDVDAEDVENQTLTYSAQGAPPWLSLDATTGVFSGTPGDNTATTETPHSITVTASETSGDPALSDSKVFTLTVNPDATKPTFTQFPTVQEVKEASAVFLWEANEPVKGTAFAEIVNQQTGETTIQAIQVNPATTAEFKTADRVTVDGLNAGTDYTAEVTIVDRRNNETVSPAVLFKTLDAADTTPPVFENLPVLVNRTENSLTYKWGANEAAKATLTLTQKDGADLNPALEFNSAADFAETGEISATGLDANALYKGRISLEDASGNAPPPAGQGGSLTNNPASIEDRTRPTPDTTKPVAVTQPVTDVTNTTANILYKTNEDATTVIEYGETNALGLTFTSDEFVRDHNARLTGLKANTKYFFRLGEAEDRSGNKMVPTAIQSFTTKENPDLAAPLFTKGPSVVSTTDIAAVLRWTNNELASFALEVTESGTSNITRVSSGDLKLTRTVTISNLKPGTDYNLSLIVTDGAGNASAARTGTFRTKDVIDTVPPRITGALTFTRDQTRIRAVWVTDEASDSRGEIFGPTVDASNIGDLVDIVNDPDLTTDHELIFTGLTADTKYTIKIRSLDANGNEVASQGEVRTRAAPDNTPPEPTGITAAADVGRALIKWQTSEPANSRVFFSTTESDLNGDASGAQSVTLAGLTTTHAVALTGLGTSATKYFYKVQSRDAAGNTSTPEPTFAKNFTTLAAEPTLRITGGTLSGSATSISTASVTWQTNVPSTSRVQFGVSTTSSVVEDDNLVTDHSVTLTGLTPGETYKFRVNSTNATGTQTVTAPGAGTALPTFDMPAAADTDPPLLVQRPSREYKADKKVILRWRTDEKSTSTVFYRKTGDTNFERQDKLPLKANFTNHLVQIEGLEPGTGYDFVIQSEDAAGNTLRFPSSAVVTKMASGRYKITGIAQLALGSFTTNQAPDTQAPVILSGPVVTSTNTNQVTLNWTTDELSTSTVNFGTGGNTDQTVEDGTLVTSHTVTITGLSASTVYNYLVSSTDPSNNGPTTSTAAVVQTSAQADVTPPVISNISTSSTFVSAADGASATITWTTDESSDSKVEYGTTAALGQNKTQSEAVTSHSVTITRLTPSTTYSFRVASTDVSGNGPATSTIATFTTAGAADTSPPTFSNISTSGTTHNKVEVSWDTNENASSVLLVINAVGDTSRVESGTLTKTHSLAAADANFISASTAYTVVVQGEDGSGNLGTSSATAVTTSAGPDVTPPAAPGNLTAEAGNAEVKLNWDAVTDTDLAGYNVFKDGGQIATNVTGTSFTSTGLTNGTAVNFEVKAVDQTGNVSTTNPSVSATPALTAAPSAPASLGTFEGGTEVTTVSLKPILVISNATPVSGRATPTYTFAVYSDAGLTNLVTSISGVIEGSATNPTHWQVTDPTLTDGIVLLDATTYHWRARANDGVTDGPWSSTKTFTTSASKPTAVELAGFTAETDRGIVDIRWQTYSNLGLRGFHVYRSVNPGGPFELISGDDLIAADQEDYVFSDRDVTINVTYYYQVQAINQDEAPQTFGPIVVKVAPPNTFTLGQNAPNPFNPTTQIRYELPVSGQVQLMVYNLLGQEVVTLVDERRQAGFHTVTWNGLNAASQSVASGVYFYRIVVNGDDSNTFSSSKKMLLLK